MNEDWDEETELFLLNLISFWWGPAFQLPMNIYNALNLRKVLSGITSKYLSIEVLTSEIFCVVYQLNKEGEKERRKKRVREVVGNHSERIISDHALGVY